MFSSPDERVSLSQAPPIAPPTAPPTGSAHWPQQWAEHSPQINSDDFIKDTYYLNM